MASLMDMPKFPVDAQLPPIVAFCSHVLSCHALAGDAVDELFFSAILKVMGKFIDTVLVPFLFSCAHATL